MVDIAEFAPVFFGVRAPRHASQRFDVAPLVEADADGSYNTASGTYRAWNVAGLLYSDSEPGLWALRIETVTGERETGILGALALDKQVFPHEAVDISLASERVERLQAVPADLSPVTVFTPAPVPATMRILDATCVDEPRLRLVDEDGTTFRLWAVPDAVAARASLNDAVAVIADGHHRVAAAVHVAQAATARTLGWIVPNPLRSAPVHRLLTSPHGPMEIMKQIEPLFQCTQVRDLHELQTELSEHRPSIGLRDQRGHLYVGRPHNLENLASRLPDGHSPLWSSLDQSLWVYGVEPTLNEITSAPSFGVEETVTKAARLDAVAVLLPPLATQTVTQLALSGEPLPPKVTRFTPKPRTGLLIRPFAGPA